MKEEKRADGLLRTYLRWPALFAILLIAATICVTVIHRRAGLVMAIYAVAGIILILILYLSSRRSILKALVGFAMDAEGTQKQLAEDIDIPYVLMDEQGNLAWRNRAFNTLISGDKAAKKNIRLLFPEITVEDIEDINQSVDYHYTYNDKKFRIRIKKTEIDGTPIYAAFLYDETELLVLKEESDNAKLVAGLIYLDNYDEAMESVEEVRRSLLMALIDRKITQYVSSLEGIVKKLEKDKYLFVIKQQYIPELKEARFDILEEVKTVNIGNEMSVTLSIGIGLGGDTYAQNYEYARMAIDMALGRGGDQVVVKDKETISYYGGKSQTVEKATRVKARVKAHALRELMETKDELIIMGHKNLDIDAFGSAIGIWRIALQQGKKAHIVIGEVNSSVLPMMDRFKGGEYPEDMFIDGAKALELAGKDTILVVVDVNRPSITESPELLTAVKTIVVLDHHRQSAEIIDHATLSYVEPFASSACEMVAEIVQYIADEIRIKPMEADAMYAGIVIDTNNFTNQAGVRTFEAAAFLRRNGADVARVRKLFRENEADYKAKAETIRNAYIFKDAYAISECPASGMTDPTLVGAQAANELLDIVGIKASVVLSNSNGLIYISARSIDEVNVQVMMEKLGGGGHRTIAGAQLEGVTMEEAKARVEDVITQMTEKGEIS